MRIAYLTPNFPPELGGMGTSCYYLANEVGKSHDVTVFVVNRRKDYKTGNYKIKYFKPWFSYGYADCAPQIMKLVKDFDIIHLYYPYYGIAEFLILLKKLSRSALGWNKKNCPKIIFHQQMDMVGKGISKFVNNIHKKIIFNWLFKNVDQIFILSEDYAKNSDLKKIFNKYPQKFQIVPNGVDTTKFKKQLTNNKKGFTIFTAQALDKQHFFKGIDVLIKSIHLLITRYTLPITLRIAGDGNLRNYYQNLTKKLGIENNVKFLGHITHDKLPEYYSQANVTAVPSTQKTESFSVTAAESMACETPVIVSDWPGLRITIENGVTGLICKPNDEKDLAEKIKYLYNNPQKLNEMSLNSRKRAVENFDWKSISEKCVQNYSALVKEQRDPSLRSGQGSKKLCLITSVFAPYNKGGAETIVNNIVDGFKKTEHPIFVITICPFKNLSSFFPKKTFKNGVLIYRFYPLNIFSFLNINNYKNKTLTRLLWHGFDMFNLHSYFVVKKILKKEKPDVVMTHMLKGIGYLVPRAIHKCKIKNIHTVHEVQLATPSGLILKNEENSWQHTCWLTKMYQSFNRKLFKYPEIIISSSNFLLDFYNKRKFFTKSKKIVLTNPMNISLQKDFKKNIDDKFNFLFIGQIEEHKGIFLLINVFKKLLNKINNEDVNLLIVGTGSVLEQAKKLAGDNEQIKFLGYVPNRDLNKIFAKTNILIIPSLCYENSPTVIFESLSYKTPVLAARIGGIEFIKDNYNGFTFEAGDEKDLLRVLKFSLENKKQLAQMSTNCLKSVENIGVKNYIEKLEELI